MNIYARAALSGLFLLTLTGVPAAHSGEYYIYRDPNGRLVISNQKPPPGSQILRQRTLPDDPESMVPQAQGGGEPERKDEASASNSTQNR